MIVGGAATMNAAALMTEDNPVYNKRYVEHTQESPPC